MKDNKAILEKIKAEVEKLEDSISKAEEKQNTFIDYSKFIEKIKKITEG